MALNHVKELRLTDAGLVDLYEENLTLWRELAEHAYEYAKNYIAAAGAIRQDDVVPALQPVLEVTPALREFLAGRSLRQQYWYEWFAELVIDRLWDDLDQAGKAGG